MRSILIRIIGVVLLIAAIFLPLPSPFNDINAKISEILTGISLIGKEIFFIRRNIVTLIMFFCAVSSIIPISLPIKIILFIISLDLITFPIISELPILNIISGFIQIVGININKISGRIFLVITLFGLNALGLGALGIDAMLIIIFVIVLTAGEIALHIVSFGLIPWKAIAIFIIGLIWVFNLNWMMALIPAVGEFLLDHIL